MCGWCNGEQSLLRGRSVQVQNQHFSIMQASSDCRLRLVSTKRCIFARPSHLLNSMSMASSPIIEPFPQRLPYQSSWPIPCATPTLFQQVCCLQWNVYLHQVGGALGPGCGLRWHSRGARRGDCCQWACQRVRPKLLLLSLNLLLARVLQLELALQVGDDGAHDERDSPYTLTDSSCSQKWESWRARRVVTSRLQ